MAAIEGAAALVLHRVEFESDSLNLMQALNSSSNELGAIGVLLREAISNCISAFERFEFIFCPRRCNTVAHTLT
jgi:hypothetical protein